MQSIIKIKEFVKKNKIDIYIFGGMVAFVFIICSNFLHVHFAQDTYCVYSFGWDKYIEIFLQSSRIFSALLLFIFKVLNISLETGIVISSIIAILVLSTTWFLLYKYIYILVGKENNVIYNICIGVITFAIIFNFCTFEINIFMESAVMALSILFVIIASILYASGKYVKSIITLLIASLCYQGTLGLFIIMTLVFIAYKNKENIKEIFKKSIGVYIFYGAIMIINLLLVKLFLIWLQDSQRQMGLITFTEMISSIFKYGKIVLINNVGIGPKGLYLLAIIFLNILFIATIIKNKRYFHILEYIVLIVTAILIPVLPVLTMPLDSQYIEARMCICFGSILGILALYLIIVMKINEKKIINKIFYIFLVGLLMINSFYFIRASSENIATNYLDKNVAESIIAQIDEYENRTGIEVENIAIFCDTKPASSYNNQEVLGSTTARAMVTDWAIIPVLEYHSGKKYNETDVTEDIKKEFEGKNWDYYSDEQLIFKGDTLYLCVF